MMDTAKVNTQVLFMKRIVKVDVYRDTTLLANFDSLNIGGRIDFSVVRWGEQYNSGFNTAQIKLFNINDDTFTLLNDRVQGKDKRPLSIVLYAGYEKTYQAIFAGTIFSVTREKNMTDVITTLFCSTGESLKTLVSESIGSEGQAVSKFLIYLVKKCGLDVSCNTINEKLTNLSFSDELRGVLNTIANQYQLEWYLDNNNKIIFNKTQNVKRLDHKITPESGLMKPPVVTEKGCDVEMFLDPSIKPLETFTLDSEFITYNLGSLEFMNRITGAGRANPFKRASADGRFKGTFKIIHLQHQGSTHTNQWVTTLDGITV